MRARTALRSQPGSSSFPRSDASPDGCDGRPRGKDAGRVRIRRIRARTRTPHRAVQRSQPAQGFAPREAL
jgi:hypothetical protein